MSSTSLSVGRRVLGSAASIIFVVLLVISQSTKSKAGTIIYLLSLLSLAPVVVTTLLVEFNARRSASTALGAELPRPVVEVRRTRARATAARSLLRACRSLPSPSTHALYVMASRYITVFDTTLSRLYLFKHAFDCLVNVRLAASPETRTWTVTVLNGLREREAVVTTWQRLSSPLGPVLAPVERPAIAQPEDQVGFQYLSSALRESPQVAVLSVETLATSQATSPADTISISSPLDPIAPTPLSGAALSTSFTPSKQTTSELICDATPNYADDKTKDLTAALIPNETRLAGVTSAASVNEKLSQTSLPEMSRIPFCSPPGPPEDNESGATNADSLVPRPSAMNAMGIVLSPLDTVLPRTLPSITLTPSHQKTSEVIFDATSDYVGTSTSDPAPASDLNDARYSGVSVATSSMSGGMTQNNLFGISNIPFPSLPGLPNNTRPPTTNANSLVSKPGGMNVLGLFLSAPSSKTVPSACSPARAKHDINPSSVSFKRSRKLALKGGCMKPVGWRGKPLDEATTAIARRATIALPQLIDSALSTPSISSNGGTPANTIISSPAPTQSTAPTSIDPQPDEWETGTPSSIACSPLESPNDLRARGAEASFQEAPDDGKVEETVAWWRNDLQSKDVRSARRNRYGPGKSRCNASESTTDEEWRWAKTEGKKPVGGRRPLGVTKPASSTTFVASDTVDAEREEGPTDEEEDDLDEGGFSKSQQQEVKEASKQALAMPFYGASTSRALQLLSEEEWASLEQFNATSSNLREVSPPPTPFSTGIETEVAQSWLLPPPPTLDAAPTKIKRSSRTKKVLKKIMKRVKNTFHLKSRGREAGVA